MLSLLEGATYYLNPGGFWNVCVCVLLELVPFLGLVYAGTQGTPPKLRGSPYAGHRSNASVAASTDESATLVVLFTKPRPFWD